MGALFGYCKLFIAALLVVLAAALVYLAEKRTRFGEWKPWRRQAVIGLLFGLLAVLATEYGINIDGATLNVRDAAPLAAGLIFGAPAGVIAGIIGGVERWFAVYWGAGEYTRVACSVSTILAGCLAAALRKYLFDNKKPTWFYGLATGLVMEVLHMLMLFVTNMDDVHGAFLFVRQCAAPMIVFNGLAVMLAVLAVSIIGKEPLSLKKEQKKISQAFQRWLLLCVVVAFCVTCVFTVVLQTRLSYRDAEQLLKLNLADVRADIQDVSNENLLRITRNVAKRIDAEQNPDDMHMLLGSLSYGYSIAEIILIDENGIITDSTNPDFIGFDMASGEQSAAFLPLLDGQTELVQDYQPISYDAAIYRKFAGVSLEKGGFVQVGYDAENFQKDIAETVGGVTHNRHVGEGGSIIIADQNRAIVSDRMGYEGESLLKTGIWFDRETVPQNTPFYANVYGERSICIYDVSEGYTIIATMPQSEALFTRDISTYVMALMEIILFAVLFAMIYFLIKRLVVNNIHEINRSLAKITSGNLDVTVNVRSNAEFASLSDDINSTIVTLKRYIAEAAARIDQELEFARTIQHASLPSVFPPFPGHTEFDLYALMDAAKEVGGDFFDFYFVGEDQLALLIADVSGKGIPAAMLMMKAKTLIKSLAEAGLPTNEVMTRANDELCSGNDAGMFVTVWLGILDIRTGRISYTSAGHNPPLIGHDGAYAFVKSKSGLVLAGMEGMRYRQNELTLAPGDVLFLYTDGVTEATDAQNRLYGEERLRQLLDASPSVTAEALTALVRRDIDLFVGEAPQFDDITMLALRFFGSAAMHEITVVPSFDQTEPAARFVEDSLKSDGCPEKLIMKMNVAFDELFSNIVRYSGASEAHIMCGVTSGTAVLTLSDNGTPYNPVQASAPDVTLPMEEREIGGLGIHMVRKLMDRMAYAYVDGRNVLTVSKRLS